MNAPAKALSESHDVSAKVTQMLQTRTKTAIERYGERVRRASERSATDLMPKAPVAPWQLWTSGARYAVDAAQRSILLLRHAAPARQQLPRARAAGPAAGAALRVRGGDGGPLARAPGQLRAAAHRSAGGRHASTSASVPTSSSIRAAATAPASAASRTTRRSASRCTPAIRSTSSSSTRTPSPGRRCSTCPTPSASSCTACARCTRTRPSPRSSATARRAGRR